MASVADGRGLVGLARQDYLCDPGADHAALAGSLAAMQIFANSAPSRLASSASPPAAQRARSKAAGRPSTHQPRAKGQAASCSISSAEPRPPARPTTLNRSGCALITSSVCRPIDPVDPSTTTPVTGRSRRPAGRSRQGQAPRTGMSRSGRGSRHARGPGSPTPCGRRPASASTRPGLLPARPGRSGAR